MEFNPAGLLALNGGHEILTESWANLVEREEAEQAAKKMGKDGAGRPEAATKGTQIGIYNSDKRAWPTRE